MVLFYLSTYRLTYQPTCLPAYLSTCLPAYLPTYLPTRLSACLPTYLPICPCQCLIQFRKGVGPIEGSDLFKIVLYSRSLAIHLNGGRLGCFPRRP